MVLTDGSEREGCVVSAVSFLANAITMSRARAPTKSDDESPFKKSNQRIVKILFYVRLTNIYCKLLVKLQHNSKILNKTFQLLLQSIKRQ